MPILGKKDKKNHVPLQKETSAGENLENKKTGNTEVGNKGAGNKEATKRFLLKNKKDLQEKKEAAGNNKAAGKSEAKKPKSASDKAMARAARYDGKTWWQRNWSVVVLTIIFLIGVGLIAYPTFADWWNSFHQARAVSSYMEAVTDMNADDYAAIIDSALEYNEKLAESGVTWNLTDEQREEYMKQLDVDGSGIMGYIDIPKIHIKLPVYHGVSDAVLQVAIGHIEGSSLPVGGESAHCVVSGHRGLPSARLFTDLDKLVETDIFTMTVLNYTTTYEVDQIRIVEPTNLSDLNISQGKDYFTLVTCTPYGINTHRLLVRAHRIDNINGPALVTADALQIEPVYIAPFIAAPTLVFLVILMFISTGHAVRKKKKRRAKYGDQVDEEDEWEDDADEEEEIRRRVRRKREKQMRRLGRGKK